MQVKGYGFVTTRATKYTDQGISGRIPAMMLEVQLENDDPRQITPVEVRYLNKLLSCDDLGFLALDRTTRRAQVLVHPDRVVRGITNLQFDILAVINAASEAVAVALNKLEHARP